MHRWEKFNLYLRLVKGNIYIVCMEVNILWLVKNFFKRSINDKIKIYQNK